MNSIELHCSYFCVYGTLLTLKHYFFGQERGSWSLLDYLIVVNGDDDNIVKICLIFVEIPDWLGFTGRSYCPQHEIVRISVVIHLIQSFNLFWYWKILLHFSHRCVAIRIKLTNVHVSRNESLLMDFLNGALVRRV